MILCEIAKEVDNYGTVHIFTKRKIVMVGNYLQDQHGILTWVIQMLITGLPATIIQAGIIQWLSQLNGVLCSGGND